MPKRPKWMYEIPVIVAHPSLTLRQAAKVLRHDAKRYRADKNKDAAIAAMRIASSLDEVANGKSWADAFTFQNQ